MTSIADVFVRVRADTDGLAGEIEQGAAPQVEKAGKKLSKKMGGPGGFGNRTVLNAIGAAAGEIVGTAIGRGAGSVLNGSAADSLGRFSTNLNSLGGGLAALGVGAGALGTVAALTDGLSGASDLLAHSTGALTAVKGLFIATTNAETGAVTRSGIARARDMAVTIAHTVAEKGAAAAAKVFAAGQWLVNAALTANPIGLVIVGIAALVAGFVLAYKKSETFRGIVNKVWDVLKKFIGFTPLGALIENVDKVRDAFGWVIDKVQALIDLIKKIPTPHIPSLPHIPGFASGGVLGRGLSLVGEKGPELIASAHGGQRVFTAAQTRRMGYGAAGILAGWKKAERASDHPNFYSGSLDVNPNARLDTSQIIDRRPGARQHRGGLTIHGGVTVIAHKVEDSGDAISRGLRNLSHRLGF
jgi:hypothetical protein